MPKAVVVLSGGLDSSVAAYKTRYKFPKHELYAISFNYGQKHAKELKCATKIANSLNMSHSVVDLKAVGELLSVGNSSLISDAEVPDGHYAEETMKSTVVPNRNMIMASIAAGYVTAIGANLLVFGVHGGDHFVYPDCRPEFFTHLVHTILYANEGFIEPSFNIYTPYMNKSKNDIALDAFRLRVPIQQTWSCYKGGILHCGSCGTCVERQEAIHSTGMEDPTVYENPNYWRSVIPIKVEEEV